MPTAPPPPPTPLYGVVRADAGTVVIDTADAALARLVEILDRRPSLLASLADASYHAGTYRPSALASLRADPDVRAAFSMRLDVDDATRLATAIITAASTPGSPGPAAVRAVGGGADRSANPPGRTPR